MVHFLRGVVFGFCTFWSPSSEDLYSTNASQWPLRFSSSPVNTGVVPVLIYFVVKIFLNDCSCSAILLRVQRLHISLDSARTVKFFLSSCQHHFFSLLGTASRSSLGLEAFQSLKLIGMWPLTIHPDCLMNFLAAASRVIGSPSGPTSFIINRPSSFFCRASLRLFLLRRWSRRL